MSHERTRVHSGSSTHLPQPSFLVFVVFDEKKLFSDVKINNAADTLMQHLFLTLTGNQNYLCPGGCHHKTLPVNNSLSEYS